MEGVNRWVGTCKWPGVHALMRRPLSWTLSEIWTSLSRGRGPHQGQFNTTNTQIQLRAQIQIRQSPYLQVVLQITQKVEFKKIETILSTSNGFPDHLAVAVDHTRVSLYPQIQVQMQIQVQIKYKYK